MAKQTASKRQKPRLIVQRVFTGEKSIAALERCSAIAQLGERLNGIHEVSGSIPLISTKSKNRISE